MPNAAFVAPRDPALFLALAPMDGVTDWVHRTLAGELGGVSLCVSEFVRVTDRAPPASVFLRDVPELEQGGTTPSGVPVFVQLLGGDPGAMAAAARRAVQLGALGVDLNFGCPAKRVNQHDGGASILRCPERVYAIACAVRDAVPSRVPVTVKIRLGWDDSRGVVQLADAVARAGASWLTIHARTKQQMYAPGVDYAAIGRVRANVAIELVANGDIFDAVSLGRCVRESRAHGFMLGRGALADPDLFARLRDPSSADAAGPERLSRVLLRYLELMRETGRDDGSCLRRLKQWLSLARGVRPSLSPLFDSVKVLQTLAPAVAALELRAIAPPQRAAS